MTEKPVKPLSERILRAQLNAKLSIPEAGQTIIGEAVTRAQIARSEARILGFLAELADMMEKK